MFLGLFFPVPFWLVHRFSRPGSLISKVAAYINTPIVALYVGYLPYSVNGQWWYVLWSRTFRCVTDSEHMADSRVHLFSGLVCWLALHLSGGPDLVDLVGSKQRTICYLPLWTEEAKLSCSSWFVQGCFVEAQLCWWSWFLSLCCRVLLCLERAGMQLPFQTGKSFLILCMHGGTLTHTCYFIVGGETRPTCLQIVAPWREFEQD